MLKSLRGNLLIAARSLHDPNFLRSVVLMLEHNQEGAMGLVVNSPSSISVSTALAGHFDFPETGSLVFVGGPVERNSLFVLHNDPSLDQLQAPLVEGVYVGTSGNVFEEIVRRASAGDASLQYRIISGYSGWSASQLEGELGRNDWKATPASSRLVFDTEPYSIWEEALRERERQFPLIPGAAGDERWN